MKLKNMVLVFGILISNATFSQIKKVSYSDGSQALEGLSQVPKTKLSSNPGVLVLPAWKGIDKHSEEVAGKLAEMGYHTFVADIYGTDKRPTSTKEAGELSGYFKKNVAEYQKRISLALEQLIKSGANKDNIIVIGYCFGGTGALEAARANLNVRGVISIHGGLGKNPERKIEIINPKVLVLHGADDPHVKEEEIKNFQEEMRTAKADWQMNYYANAVHAYTEKSAGNDNSKGAAYNEKADKRSWEAMKIFFKEVFN